MSEYEIVELPARPVFYLTRKTGPGMDAIASAMGEGFDSLAAFIRTSGIEVAGPPICVWTAYGETGTEFELAFPTSEAGRAKADADPAVGFKTLRAGRALKGIHMGAYSGLGQTYEAMAAHMKSAGLDAGGPMFETYLNSPGEVPEPELVTEVYMPLAA